MYKQTNPHISSLLRFLQHVTERFAPPPREGDSEQTGGQAQSALKYYLLGVIYCTTSYLALAPKDTTSFWASNVLFKSDFTLIMV